MLWTEELFHVKKPIIAMLHLEPLPGDPLFSRGTDMQQIADLAKRDLEACLSATNSACPTSGRWIL